MQVLNAMQFLSSKDYPALLQQRRFQPPEGWDWGFRTVDGVKIRYGQPRTRKNYDAVVAIVGGLGDFGEQYYEFANDLDAKNLKPIIIDLPGQGGSSRYLPDDPMKRHSDGFDKLLAQIHVVMDEIVLSSAIDAEDNHKRLPIILVAHSMGGHIALRYLAEYNKSTRGTDIFSCAILSAPMMGMQAVNAFPRVIAKSILALLSLRPKDYVPGGSAWYDGYRERPGFRGIFSSDPERYALQSAYYSHPDYAFLATGSPTNKWLLDAVKSCAILNNPEYLKKITTPVLIAVAGSDKLVDNRNILQAAKYMPRAEILTIDGAQHEIIMEKDCFRGCFIERFFTFIEDNVLNSPDKGKTYIK